MLSGQFASTSAVLAETLGMTRRSIDTGPDAYIRGWQRRKIMLKHNARKDPSSISGSCQRYC